VSRRERAQEQQHQRFALTLTGDGANPVSSALVAKYLAKTGQAITLAQRR